MALRFTLGKMAVRRLSQRAGAAATSAAPSFDTHVNYYQRPSNGTLPAVNDLELLMGDKDQATRKVTVHDVRNRESGFSMARNGFEYVKHSFGTVIKDGDDETVRRQHYPEVEAFLRNYTGLQNVHILQHMMRYETQAVYGTHVSGHQGDKGPSRRVHVDLSRHGADCALAHFFPDGFPAMAHAGYRLVNIWRPLDTVRRDPLAILDASSLDPLRELVIIPREYHTGMKAENYLVTADDNGSQTASSTPSSSATTTITTSMSTSTGDQDPAAIAHHHQWYFLSHQEPDELCVFNICDTTPGGCLYGTPHSSVALPDQDDKPARRSIEIRAVCY